MVKDMPEKLRTGELERAARGVGGERPQALAGGDEQREAA
jgi:hypothetical protein